MPELKAWHQMKVRCYTKSSADYRNYGERGIGVCEEWKLSFKAFFEHVGLRPSRFHSLHRINNDLGYFPGNVKWATSKEQNNNMNKRSNGPKPIAISDPRRRRFLDEAARRAREWRAKHPRRAIQVSKNWRARNPHWWRGRKYVEWLTTALIRGNAESKVFVDAGVTMDSWINQAPALVNGGLGSLSNGSKLAPVKSWREFDLSNPDQVKAFLAPENFKLVKK